MKYWKMGKILHRALSASQFRKFGLGVDDLSARATGADGEKRKSVKTGSKIYFFFPLINLGLGRVEIPELVADGSCSIREGDDLPGCRMQRQPSRRSGCRSSSPAGFFDAAFSLLCNETHLS